MLENLYRIRIHLVNLWAYLEKRRDSQDQIQKRRFIGGTSTSIASQQRRAFDLIDHVFSINVCQRVNSKRDVVQQLDKNSTAAVEHERSERPIERCADHYFNAAPHHLLNDDAREILAKPRGHILIRVLQGGVVCEIQRYAANFGLVNNRWPRCFKRDRVAYATRGIQRVFKP